MNEGDESFPTMKKKRGSGFRYSSKKVLERSRLTRLAKARGCEVTSVTRMLSYPSSIPSELCIRDIHSCATSSSCKSPILVSVDEF
jgi:DNA-binding transcriptional MerR regulator